MASTDAAARPAVATAKAKAVPSPKTITWLTMCFMTNREAHAEARQFIAKLNAAGLKAPSEDAVVRLIGIDGGGYAQNPDSALLESQYAWQLGTARPASRPVILDPDFAKAAAIFVSVYAPDKLAEFQKFVDGLKTQETQ